MEVKPPLLGSGPLRGTANGSNVSFVVTGDAMQLAFDGRRDAANLNGTYLVSRRDGGPGQTGTFTLKRISLEGFNSGTNCTGDASRPATATDVAKVDNAAPTIPPAAPQPDITSELTPRPTPVTPAPELPRPAPAGFFTVGSTKEEVLAVQGTPTRISEYQWGYGLSHVSFQGGRVTSWYVSPVNALRVRMLPDSETDASAARARGYFTVGSSKDEVLAVQGTPTNFSEYQWSYGLSHVSFQNGRVTSWYVSPVNALRVKMLTSNGTAAVGSSSFFTVGSTKDEVLAVQGTPTSFSEYQWSYGLSHVSFQGGRVTSWYVSPVNALRVRMLPDSESEASAARARGYFTVGSTKDEVLGVQGTPTSLREYQWGYGLSHVSFQGGRVTTRYISPTNPLKAFAGSK